MTVPATTAWAALRNSAQEVTSRLGPVLCTVKDPGRRAVGDWTVADTAAHLLITVQFASHTLLGRDIASGLAEIIDRASGAVNLAAIAELNQQALGCQPERDPVLLARQIEDETARLLAGTEHLDGAARLAWLGGVDIPRNAVLAHLVSEMWIHGRDIAKAEGRSWTIPPAPLALAFEWFFVELLQAGSDRLLSLGPDASEVSCEFRVRDCRPVTFRVGDGRLVVEHSTQPGVDVRLTADPVSMLLVMYGRLNPAWPMLRGRLRLSGRRPWRLGRFMRAVPTP